MRNLGNVAGDVNRLREEREARQNPPDYEIGQGDSDGWDFFDDVPSSSGMDETSFMGTQASNAGGFNFDSSNLDSLGGFQNNMQSQQDMAKSMTATEDKIIDGAITVGKAVGKGSKELFNGVRGGLQDNDALYWTVYGKKVIVTSIYVICGGIVLSILGLFSSAIGGGFWISIGGALSLSFGLVVFSINHDRVEDIPENAQEEEIIDLNEDEGVLDDGFSSSEDYYEEEEEVEEDEDYNPWGAFDNMEEVEEDEEEVAPQLYKEDINIESAIESIREIPPHTQTRQYLFEEYSRVLPLINPDFSQLKTISENSDNFIIFDKILRDAAIQVGTHEDKLPELLELRENQFIIQIKATRPTGLKEDDIANEISNIYSRDEFGGVVHEGVYATTSSVGSNYIINIFKGENSLVTLADTYREVKDFILNPSVKKPIVIGVNELGRVWKFDAEKVYSYIVSGKPRTGKSWVVVSLVLQLCMYSSPKEVTFEALDVKDTSSDFYSMKDYLPHFKNFEGSSRKILSRLRYLTTVEAERRRKILNKYDVINIADLKNKGVDVDIPYHYVIIDEILGLKGELSKDEDNEFKSLINTIVTQMPNLGFRVILVPHRVTNDVIPKTTYTLVGFVACVKSDFKEINTTLEVTKSDFPYTLSNIGDMALKTGELNRGSAVFSHGIAITDSNEGNRDIYRFVGSLWNMLEPELEETKVNENHNYKGHNLEGVQGVLDDEDFLSSKEGDSEYIDIFNDIFGDD